LICLKDIRGNDMGFFARAEVQLKGCHQIAQESRCYTDDTVSAALEREDGCVNYQVGSLDLKRRETPSCEVEP
jgi:hypothetical protein